MFNFPRHLILPEKVYIFSVIYQSEVGRAVNRNLIDYFIELKNPLDKSDSQKLLLGMTKALALGYRERNPLEWLLCRLLCDYLKSNSVHLLDGNDGEVLGFNNYKKYLGQTATDEEIQEILRYLFDSWIRTFPEETLSWREIYVSAITVPEESLKKCLGAFHQK
jgi:hypothetical protein